MWNICLVREADREVGRGGQKTLARLQGSGMIKKQRLSLKVNVVSFCAMDGL